MSVFDNINQDWKTALKEKNIPVKKVLTFARSKLQAKAKELKADSLNDTETIKVLMKMVKEQEELVNNYGGDDAKFELSVLKSYLPQMMTEEEVNAFVSAHIAALPEAPQASDFGKVMGPIMKELMGKADGKVVRASVQAALKE